MADDERPNIEQSVEKPQPEPKVDETAALLEELKRVGVERPEQVANIHRASQESGRLAQMLGEERKRNEEMQRQLQEIQARANRPVQEEYGSHEVDLEAVIERKINHGLESFWERKNREAQEANARRYAEFQEIQNHPRFGFVKDRWERHLKDPNVVNRLQSGQVSPKDEFAEVLYNTYDEVLLKSREALEKTYSTSAPPHIESGDQRAVPKTPADQEKQEKLRTMTKPDRWQGTDDDIAKLMGTVMPPDDPFWNK